MYKKLLLSLTFALIAIIQISAQSTKKVTGIVVAADDGFPLPGATVIVVGHETVGAAADINGNFALEVPANAKSLQVGFVGMKTIVVPIKYGSLMKIALSEDSELVDEVIVTGYGSAKKLGSVVGSVAAVSADKIQNIPTANFTDALQGQVAGLSVLSSSGEPTASAVIRLRGVNSISAGNTPLFILDGSPITTEVFNALNPSDIASISVLKDAASTAIYGSRAANGVIVLTSKKGKMGEKPTVKIAAQYGVSNVINSGVKMMNSAEYMKFREMLDPSLTQNATWLEHKNVVTKNGIDTDWQDYIYRDNAPTFNINASVTGGSENTNYYLSLNHFTKEGIEPMSSVSRESVRFNEDIRMADIFKIGLDVNLSYNQSEINPEQNSSSGLFTTNPTIFSRLARPDDSPNYYTYDENGKATFLGRADYLHESKLYNPYYLNENRTRKSKVVHLDASLYEQLNPIQGLTIRAAQALSGYDEKFSNILFPVDAYVSPMGDVVDMFSDGSSAYRTESTLRSYTMTSTNTAEYMFTVNSYHNLSFLLGHESIYTKGEGFGATRNGLTDVRLLLLTNGTEEPTVSQEFVETVFNSFFGEGTYNYREKYFFNASIRRDGSSRFAKNHRWSTFWSVGGRWNVMKESFMANLKPYINQFDVKLSYGTTGNSSIDDYAYLGLASGSNVQYDGNSGMVLVQPSNDNLTWETVAQTNFGIETRLFNRLTIGIDYYHKKTSDMLLSIPYSYTTGYGSGQGNIGAMVNQGFDLEVGYDIMNRPDMYWNVRANVNYNKNEITELFNGLDEYEISNTGLKLQVGKPYGEFYTVKRAYIDSRDGSQVWYDADGNLTKTYDSDNNSVFTGKQRFAPWTGGFGTTFQWKGLSVSADFTFALGKYALNNDRYFYENAQNGATYNQSKEMLNMWTTPGQITNIPAAGEVIQMDDHLIENASFCRLKKLTIGYNLPKQWFGESGFVKGANVYVTGRNLLTFTSYSGYDPEPDTNVIQFNYPNTREYTIGCEITF
ncbi:MAG: TonB-dependent receptor [Bacteroides sp.]|nr:TonB-dependent receptor [Roseburia sp.]MCM1346285.1 TonB-dependent receptor [Bacteroides sp.]MCM1420860.1 TonB-dependent receptor [Bacteroides sp.]